jgi:hypothetical protein
LRVRLEDGAGGWQRGVLLRCETREGRTYWRVRLQAGGAWRPPAGLVVDGPGDERLDACAECRLPFFTCAESGEILCRRCDAELFGTAVRAREPDPPHPFDEIPAHRRRS